MRTTLTIERDVAERLSRALKKRKTSFKRVVNDALRRGLDQMESESGPAKPFVVQPFANMELFADITCTSKLMSDLELEDFVATQKKQADDSR